MAKKKEAPILYKYGEGEVTKVNRGATKVRVRLPQEINSSTDLRTGQVRDVVAKPKKKKKSIYEGARLRSMREAGLID